MAACYVQYFLAAMFSTADDEGEDPGELPAPIGVPDQKSYIALTFPLCHLTNRLWIDHATFLS
jgi:hypothetical protein